MTYAIEWMNQMKQENLGMESCSRIKILMNDERKMEGIVTRLNKTKKPFRLNDS